MPLIPGPSASTSASATVRHEQGEYAIYDPYNPSLDRGPCSFNSNQIVYCERYLQPAVPRQSGAEWLANQSHIQPTLRACPSTSRTWDVPVSIQHWRRNRRRASQSRPRLQPHDVRKIDEWYNPACFVLQPYGTIGNSGRNSLNNPNYFDWDFAIMKQTKLTEKFKRAAPGGVLRYRQSPQHVFWQSGHQF